MTDFIIEGTPIAQPPEPAAGTIIEPTDGVRSLQEGDSLKFVAGNPNYVSQDYTVQIKRYQAGGVKNPATDYTVQETTRTADASGYFSTLWVIDAPLTQFSGGAFKYYIATYPVADPTKLGYTAADFTLLDPLDVVFMDLELALGPVQAIPVYKEVSKDSTTPELPTYPTGRCHFDFTWDNWRDDYAPVVFQLQEDGETAVTPYAIDYEAGILEMSTPVPLFAEIEASYVFRYYSKDDLHRFLSQAVNQVNYTRPQTSYNLRSYPRAWSQLIVAGAAQKALEQLFMSQIFVERKLLFAQVDVVSTLSGYYNQLSQFWTDSLKQKNRWSLVGPRAISGHDLIAPPRITGQNFWTYAYLRGRAL